MRKYYPETLFTKVLVPFFSDRDSQVTLTIARAIACEGQVVLAGIVSIPPGESLSTAALSARTIRKTLQQLAKAEGMYARERVQVSHKPWEELVQVACEEQPDLLVLEWPGDFEALGTTLGEVFSSPPCDLAVVSGSIPDQIKRILVSIRGGPYAELALRCSLSLASSSHARLMSLHLIPTHLSPPLDAPFRGIDKVLSNLPEVERCEIETNDPATAILSASEQADLVVIGATARLDNLTMSVGPVAGRILEESAAGLVIVKTKHPLPPDLHSEAVGQTAISVLVDKWFGENTYHAEEFEDLEALLALKRQQNLTISLALPALNEEETVGNVIRTIKTTLMDQVPLLDEMVLIDSDSTDRTRQLAASLGIPVFIHQHILPRLGARRGKGEALWKSLYVTRGDILIWIDTDIKNIDPVFVYGLLGPLLQRPDIQFVKGFYRRPLRVGDKYQAGGGGRVTELTARPLLNLFYPELSGIVQPLAGEYGGRRAALEQLPFYSGYGVEIGLLIDILEQLGLGAIGQVDLQERVHHNQSLESLSKMSFAIIQAVFNKLERRYGCSFLEDVNRSMKLIHYESGRLCLDVEEIAEKQRPPMLEQPEYAQAQVAWRA